MMQRMMSAAVLAATSATFAGTLECAPQQTAKLTADDGASYDYFGYSVATSGGVAVIGAFGGDDNGFDSGSAYVYEQQADGTWQQLAKLTADDGASDDYFGHSVATSGGVAVIGAWRDDDNGYSSGSAYVYEQQADGTWQQTAKLTADDGASYDYFGYSVATSGGVAVIGARYDDDNGSSSGSAYVYEQQADGAWQQIAKLTADDGASGDEFGHSVATSGGVAVIGAFRDDSYSGSAYVFEQQADGTWQQIAKLTADDGVSYDYFGISVATSGGVAVIGAYGDDDNGAVSGSAYVYEQQADGTWQQTAKLTADDGASDDQFGVSVATSGGVAVIGAYGDDDNGDYSGTAYVYEQQADGTWQQTAKLTADDGASSDLFGNSVATSGGVAVIGALYDDDNGSSSGSAYVYEQQADGTWQQIAKLTADDGASSDYFGYSVATSGGVAVIGAFLDGDNGSQSGSAYVFEQQADGTWQQIAKLTADDGASSDYFGYSVATSGGVAVIGAFLNDDNGTDFGSAYVYEQQADGTWQQTAKLTADDGASYDRFGSSVATSGGVAVIGAYGGGDNGFDSGSAYIYEQQADGTWQQIAKLTADDGASDDRFGSSVATSGGVAVIGAWRDDDNGYSSGSAYVYEQQADGTWQQTAKLTADDGASGDEFGSSVATSGGVAVIGAYRDDDNGAVSGSAYVYEQQADGAWQQIAKLTADDGASYDYFGYSVATSGGVAVIGAYGDDDNGTDSGSAYIYEQQADGTWQQIAKLTVDDGASSDYFGRSVATSGGVAVIGADQDDDNGTDSGSAYVFEQQVDGGWNPNALTDCNENGICDFDEIADAPFKDANENGILDECEVGACCISTTVVCEIAQEYDCLRFGGQWQGLGTTCEDADCPTSCLGDVTGDGEVSVNDVLTVIGNWGVCP